MSTLLLMSDETFTDQFDPPRLARLTALTGLATEQPVDDLAEVSPEVLGDVDLILSGWGAPRLDSAALASLPRLRTVIHCAGSVKHMVTPELYARGIQVSSAADMNAIPVAEFTLAAVIMAGKKAPFLAADARTHREDWSYRHARGPMSNLGLRVGIVGFSRIGRLVVKRLQQLDEVSCLVYDPFADPDKVASVGGRLVELPELLGSSDILSIHAPALPSTYRMIGAAQLELLPDHATVINTARGQLIDTSALERECASGRLNAILDVTDPEPLPSTSVLYDLPNVMITPHIAGSLDSEIRRMTDHALEEVQRITRGQGLRHAVVEADLSLIA